MADCRNVWQLNTVHSIQETEADSLTGRESKTHGNRVNYCLVISLAERPLHVYRLTRIFLEILYNTIAGYKSLFEDGKIIRWDILENNIIITKFAIKEAPKGKLINLEFGIGKEAEQHAKWGSLSNWHSVPNWKKNMSELKYIKGRNLSL